MAAKLAPGPALYGGGLHEKPAVARSEAQFF
jgi:hypothetical protein